MRTHLIHRPARDIIPPLGGARVSFYWIRCCTVFYAVAFGRPCRQTNGRSKRTCELTSSIVPRGTSFHRSVELECPSIGLDAARFFMLLLLWPVLGSSGTRCRQPICGA